MYNSEFQQLGSYIANVATKEFNGVSLFDNTAKTVTIDSDASTWSMAAINMGNTPYLNLASASIATSAAAPTALWQRQLGDCATGARPRYRWRQRVPPELHQQPVGGRKDQR